MWRFGRTCRVFRFLGISGSLRASSANTALLNAAVRCAPAGVELILEPAVGLLPHFNPDLEGTAPPSVAEFRARLAVADAVLLSTPEYAHGVPGSLKNALDWVVGSGEFSGKPVALFNASPRASIAQESLAEILRTMDARLVADAFVTLPLLGGNLGAADIASDAALSRTLRSALAALVRDIESRQAAPGFVTPDQPR